MTANFGFPRLILFLLLKSICLSSCGRISSHDSEHGVVRNMPDTASPFLPHDLFEKNKNRFSTDTSDILDKSSQGGTLVKYLSDSFPFKVYEFWMYGDAGKMNALYFLASDGEILLVKNVRFDYDTVDVDSSQTRGITEFLVYHEDSAVQVFSGERTVVEANAEVAYRKALGAYDLLRELLAAAEPKNR